MIKQSLLTPSAAPLKNSSTAWVIPNSSARSLAVASYATQHQQVLLILVENNQAAEQLRAELAFYTQDFKPTLPISLFPDRETLPYDYFSPHEDIISDRLSTLSQLPHWSSGIVIAPVSSALQYLPPKQYLQQHILKLQVKDHLHLEPWLLELTQAGYRRVDTVMSHGEYALRGSILDIFPAGSPHPIRIDYFDDEIDSLRYFDPDTQHSTEKITQINLLPAQEYPLTEKAIQCFRQRWRETFSGNPTDSIVYTSVSQGEPIAGIEYYLPLFYEKTQTLLDYLPNNACIFLLENTKELIQEIRSELEKRYEQLQYNKERPLLMPNRLYLNNEQFHGEIKRFPTIYLANPENSHSYTSNDFQLQTLPKLLSDPRSRTPFKSLSTFLEGLSIPVLFCVESQGRREILVDMLKPFLKHLRRFDAWQDFLNHPETGIIIAPIGNGYISNAPSFVLIGESDLFGAQASRASRRREEAKNPELMIKSLSELTLGNPVVHITHGVGRYQGLKRITTEHNDSEYAVLNYADNDLIYIPIDRLECLSRYISPDPEHAPLHKLGNKHWQIQKQKALKKIQDVAAELLKIYSERAANPGFAFKKPDEDTRRFRAAFPFAETPDQTQAINAVIEDMTSQRAMDRLVCGDVGFGKTEVAMQAAFLAVQGGKQVALLVPTTILAKQHLQSFQNRFADFPASIKALTRFSTGIEQQEIQAALETGKLDIIIGTHKLLNKAIHYRDLGLLIIDEEHRFGVKQKERIKALRAHVDILTLTATPIPRTLNMAFSGIRDLSIIASPPEKRLSVRTFLRENSDALVQEAIGRELMRGGQVYFLHNDISSIQATTERIKTLVPQARIAVAHGKTPKSQLERIMLDFYHQKLNILVCTTIIESGIDVPTANTIIMDRADKLGLAQLHQLRGRVGRSHHQAYAYLLVPHLHLLKDDAKKRLEAISTLQSLGAGFNLASHDLEIRGAGELLGEEQSGHIEAIGFTLFMDMLHQAIEALKQGKTIEHIEAPDTLEIELHISALIPDQFIPDVNTRLSLYQSLSQSESLQTIQDFTANLIDRFGKLPPETENLLALAKLKLLAKSIGIEKINLCQQQVQIYFNEKPRIQLNKLIELIQKPKSPYQLIKGRMLRFPLQASNPQQKIHQIEKILSELQQLP